MGMGVPEEVSFQSEIRSFGARRLIVMRSPVPSVWLLAKTKSLLICACVIAGALLVIRAPVSRFESNYS